MPKLGGPPVATSDRKLKRSIVIMNGVTRPGIYSSHEKAWDAVRDLKRQFPDASFDVRSAPPRSW